MSHRVAHVGEIPAVAAPVEGLTWHPVRHTLDIQSFGTNAYTAAAAGDLLVEPHDEDEFEELYVVLAGAARFTVDGETFDASAGALVLVTPPSHRVAHATEPGAAILAVGAVPGRAFAVSGWEERWLGRAAGQQ
ncbi:MAG TPA: cupin domain-containing protein [Solirubrobacteraceae bacterium]|nr:cupin domain-containing protein [Solirubrobacteraceae bacterium]